METPEIPAAVGMEVTWRVSPLPLPTMRWVSPALLGMYAYLPVRALGKCGGSLSDIAEAIRWAAGLQVPGVPANPTPAQVINLSLGWWRHLWRRRCKARSTQR